MTRLRHSRAVAAASALLVVLMTAGGCAAAPAAPELSGDTLVHDPAFVAGEEGEPSFLYSTGDGRIGDGNIQIRRSDDGAEWEDAGTVWDEKPAWLVEAVPGVDNLWAPELYEHDGTWYLYYSASTFGKNSSLIALATNTTLDPDDPDYEWVDQGVVIESAGTDFNAIDPGIVEDEHGEPWMAFGSFWSGIRMVPLEWPSGLRADDTEPLLVADRQLPPNAIEAPFILPHDGLYYLFVSKDFCCQGVDSTYSIAVGRSESVTGPYVDADGVPLLEDGGTPVLATDGARVGPGGQSVSGGLLAFHYYDADLDGQFRLGLLPLAWRDGWPHVAWPPAA
ncbi:arabinan endo-1,5-alpha-L-arabinosidase [Microbacterium sp. M3]|uniref:Arabinan endo-1,5-alpha-L-arabinosidase n=1 Tax=Microbacterium arthrosphaerae TaxID=792652 RepID=A0ABU4GYC2_9MICO|nr:MULTISPECIES: arabinan endo-1,5-alpha-L-arabinosidase [Microbacterium]MDW4572072.1 arabinan endo-1,5-alpha-L-arabinosidase [Microbacterium arthrosphaerae]MDW7605927.1 arabinan endo-1,5-alpha-L-arabinosidase [Microbacterium sp. M3]